MQSNPLMDWQRLTELYRAMSDDELQNLSADSVDLTEVARQVLHDEIKKRGLQEPTPLAGQPWGFGLNPPDAAAEQEIDLADDSILKLPLCECNGREEAWQISEVLRQAGIESWIETSRPGLPMDMSNPRVLVAADRLNVAREIVARPIPKEIVDQSKMDLPDFEPPACPACGATDPLLEGVDPLNQWRCARCGRRWTESAANPDENPQ
jgi:hypothetical protein